MKWPPEQSKIIMDPIKKKRIMKSFARFAAGAEYCQKAELTEAQQKDRAARIAFYAREDQAVADGTPLVLTQEAEGEVEAAVINIHEFFFSDEFSSLRDKLPGATSWFTQNSSALTIRDIFDLEEFIGEIVNLSPFIMEEIELYKEENSLEVLSFMDFIDPGNNDGESIFSTIYERAQIKAAGKEGLSVGARRVKSLVVPTEKVFRELFGYENDKDLIKIELKISTKSRKSKSKKPVNVIVLIDFSNLPEGITLSRQLSDYDQLVYIAVAALYNARNSVISLSQIYHAMGYPGEPGKEDRKKILNSLRKMRYTEIKVNNKQEIDRKYKYPLFPYEGSLLPHEIIPAEVPVKIHGQTINTPIHLFREPPLITFSRQREHVAYIPFEAFINDDMSKTPANLKLQLYLLWRIAEIWNGRQQPKILFKTLYTELNIKSYKQQQRLPEKVYKYLDHYVKVGLIAAYHKSEKKNESVNIVLKLKKIEPVKEIAAGNKEAETGNEAKKE